MLENEAPGRPAGGRRGAHGGLHGRVTDTRRHRLETTAVGSAVGHGLTVGPAAPHGGARGVRRRPARLAALAGEAEEAGSTCFLVLRRGQVVGQWYWRGATPGSSREVFSVTKSVASTLVGIAADDGLLEIDESASVHVPAWQGTAAAAVTVRNLLSNDSGREWSAASDYTGFIRAKDRTAYAVGLPQQHRPGTVWAYNNAAIQTLDAVLVDATGQRTARFAQDRLFAPLGMRDTRLTPSGAGSTNLAFGMHSTCPDLARFGLLFAQGGRWQGRQVVSSAWVEAATGAPSQSLNAAYGYLWWLNREGNLRCAARRDRRPRCTGRPRSGAASSRRPRPTCTPRSGSAARWSWSTRHPRRSWSAWVTRRMSAAVPTTGSATPPASSPRP